MRLAIAHCTTYRFDGPVFLEPHALRLTPRGDPAQRLEAFSLSISPRPQAVSHQLDAAGNAVHRAWFLDLVGGLEIRMAAVVETMRDNPFDFLQEPMEAPGVLLAPALAPAFQAPEDVEAVALLVHQAGPLAPEDAMGFCLRLCALLHQRIEKIARQEPGVLGPAAVLASGQAACRDMTLLFMECCRACGLPARFVSGYQHPAVDEASQDAGRDLHAWAEVYLPGGGWRGFDPTHGLAVADRHVAVAAAPRWQEAMPVTGSFRGTGVTAILEHAVEIHQLPRG